MDMAVGLWKSVVSGYGWRPAVNGYGGRGVKIGGERVWWSLTDCIVNLKPQQKYGRIALYSGKLHRAFHLGTKNTSK
jgi:hypothetical protein